MAGWRIGQEVLASRKPARQDAPMVRLGPATLALVVFILTSCGDTQYSKRTYSAVRPVDAGTAAGAGVPGDAGRSGDAGSPPDGGAAAEVGPPRLYIAATAETPFQIGEPYRLSIIVGKRDVPSVPFQVTSLSVEQDGTTLLARKPSDPPLEAKARNWDGVDSAMVVWVPLDGLKWVEGSKLTVVAEVLLHGATAPSRVEQEFKSISEERSYTACQRFQML